LAFHHPLSTKASIAKKHKKGKGKERKTQEPSTLPPHNATATGFGSLLALTM